MIQTNTDTDPRPAVALVRGENRYDGVARALEHIAGQIKLGDASCVLVKPNFVSVNCPLGATHVDAVRAVLDFVRQRYDGRLVVAEGAAMAPTHEGFHNYGYEALVEPYGVELIDLNAEEDTVPVQVYDRRLRPLTVRLARTAVEADYRISVGPPKTHDTVLVTLSLKNMIMGTVVNPTAVNHDGGMTGDVQRLARLLPPWVWRPRLTEWIKGTLLGYVGGSDKMAMHQGFPAMHLNLALVAPHVWPHLAVIDGWQGMEGRGPASGDPVDWRVALAGTDALAVDVLATHLMGFSPASIGYLQYCRRMRLGVGDVAGIDVIGNTTPDGVRHAFVPHPSYERQLAWRLEGAERYLNVENVQTAPRA